MARRLALRHSSTMAGITRYTRTDNVRTSMVRVGIQKTDSGMTVSAFSVDDRVAAGWGVGGGGRHTGGNSAVVACGARPGSSRMIKTAVWFQVQEMGGIWQVSHSATVGA